jgi:hypothetical protein
MNSGKFDAKLDRIEKAVWREMSRASGEWDRKRVAELVFDLDLISITEPPFRLPGARLVLERLAEEYPDQVQKLPGKLFTYRVLAAPNIVKVIAPRDLLEQAQAKSGLDEEAAVTAALRVYLKLLNA